MYIAGCSTCTVLRHMADTRLSELGRSNVVGATILGSLQPVIWLFTMFHKHLLEEAGCVSEKYWEWKMTCHPCMGSMKSTVTLASFSTHPEDLLLAAVHFFAIFPVQINFMCHIIRHLDTYDEYFLGGYYKKYIKYIHTNEIASPVFFTIPLFIDFSICLWLEFSFLQSCGL